MKTKWIFLALAIITLTACGPSQQEIEETVQASIAATERARPTATAKPTNTPFPTATVTQTPSPSPTPDLGVIDVDPRELLLDKSDLPAAGKYILPGTGWISPLTNAEIVAEWTVKEGQEYLAETGRVHGWWVDYLRSSNQVVMPEEVYNNVVLYETTAGAQLIVTKYGDQYVDEDGYTELPAPEIGDISRAFKLSKTDASGQKRVWLRVIFSYRNVYHAVQIWGWDHEVKLQFAVDVAKKLAGNLKELPLSDSVTFTP